MGKESTALRNRAAHTDSKDLCRNESSTLPPDLPLSYHNQESLFVLNWKINFTKESHRNKIYLENKQNTELTLPSALIVTSDILKVTFGFAVPIKKRMLAVRHQLFASKRADLNGGLLWCYSYITGKGKQQNALWSNSLLACVWDSPEPGRE